MQYSQTHSQNPENNTKAIHTEPSPAQFSYNLMSTIHNCKKKAATNARYPQKLEKFLKNHQMMIQYKKNKYKLVFN
jgi:hypothetical protein